LGGGRWRGGGEGVELRLRHPVPHRRVVPIHHRGHSPLPPPTACTVGHPSPLCTVIHRTPQPPCPGHTPCVTESREAYPRTSRSITSPNQEASNVSPAITPPPINTRPPQNFKTPKRSTVPEFHRFFEIHRRRSKRSNQHRASSTIANNEESRRAGPRPPRTPPTLSRPIDGCDVRRIGPRGEGRGWGGGVGRRPRVRSPSSATSWNPCQSGGASAPAGG